MADEQPKTRKAYREQQQSQEKLAAKRDKKRVQVERDYAREQRQKSRVKPANQRFDQVTYTRVNSLKKKLNWAIGIVIVLLIIVFLVLWLV